MEPAVPAWILLRAFSVGLVASVEVYPLTHGDSLLALHLSIYSFLFISPFFLSFYKSAFKFSRTHKQRRDTHSTTVRRRVRASLSPSISSPLYPSLPPEQNGFTFPFYFCTFYWDVFAFFLLFCFKRKPHPFYPTSHPVPQCSLWVFCGGEGGGV